MRSFAAALMLTLLGWNMAPALADAPPGKYDITPLTPADVDFYLSIKRAGAACVTQAKGADKDAMDAMRRNHGVLPMPAMPNIKGNPTQAQLADLQKRMGAISDQATRNGQIETRAAAMSQCDERIAQQRGVKDRYLALKDVVEGIVSANGGAGSCGGDCENGGPKPSAAQLALWKREDAVRKADQTLLAPHAREIIVLEKTMQSAIGM